MGEYFSNTKLGTCESLMYVRREEVEKRCAENPNEINTNRGNLTKLEGYLDLKCKWIYRFPFSSEDNDNWSDINNRDYFKTLDITIDTNILPIPHKDFVQISASILGEDFATVNLPFCLYSDKARGLGVSVLNQYYQKIKVVGQKYTDDCPSGYTLFACGCCGAEFYFDQEEDLVHIKERMRDRGFSVEAERVRAKIVG